MMLTEKQRLDLLEQVRALKAQLDRVETGLAGEAASNVMLLDLAGAHQIMEKIMAELIEKHIMSQIEGGLPA